MSQDEVTKDIQRTARTRGGLAKKYEVITGKAITKENQDAINKQLGFIRIGLSAFALVALIVGAFIIYNTFSIVVAQRLREMALLRAIGASRRQVLGSVIGESLVVGIIASVIGVVAGVLVAIGLKALLNVIGFGLPGSGVVVKPDAVVTGLLAGTIVTFVSAIVPARQAARIPPIAAMRTRRAGAPAQPRRCAAASALGITAIGVLLAARSVCSGAAASGSSRLGALLILLGVFVLSPLFARGLALAIGTPLRRIKGITGELARENAARNPRRTATTGAAVMIAVSLVGFITIFAASANASISAAIDSQLKTDYIITSGGGNGAPHRTQPHARQGDRRAPGDRTAARRSGSARRASTTAACSSTQPTPSPGAALTDLDGVAGSFAAIENNGIAVSKRKADANHWKLGSVIPVTFVKTGKVPLTVRYIYKANTFGDYFISLKTYEKNFTDQLDFLILAKLKPGVSAEQGRKAIEPLLKPYPIAKLKDNAQYKADQKQQVNQVLEPVLRAAVPRGHHRADRHRQHDDAVDLRAHEGARAVARRGREPAADAVDDPLGGGDHRVARHVARHRDRVVLRLGGHQGPAGPGLLEVLTRARAARGDRRDRRVRIGDRGACFRPDGRRGSTCSTRSSTNSGAARSQNRTAPGRARPCRGPAARGRPGSAPSRCASFSSLVAENAYREQAGVARVAHRNGRDRDAGRHLHDRHQRIEAVELRERTGTPITGSGVIDAVMPGRWAAPPAPAMITRSPRSAAVRGVLVHHVGRAVRGDDADLVGDAELGEHVDGALHHRQIGVAAHDHADERLRGHADDR